MNARPKQLKPAAKAAVRAVKLLGGPVAAARRLEVGRYQTIQSWMRHRIPAEYCPAIERALDGKMRCEDMRPDIPWGMLREQAGQTAGA